MKRLGIAAAITAVFIFGINSLSYSQPMTIQELVDSFQKATDLQKEQILQDNLGKNIAAGGAVANAGQYDFFDIVNDFRGTYYQVTVKQQKTKANTPYQVVFLFKDKSKIEDVDKGQDFQKDGSVIRILDERLQITVWLFCDSLSEDDKRLIRQDYYSPPVP